MKNITRKKLKQKKGFTLVEVLIAATIFAILVSIAAGGFANALRTQRELAGLIQAQSNAGIALEQMAREIRTGYLFCTVPGSTPVSPATPNTACQLSADKSFGCSVTGGVWTCKKIIDFYNGDSQNVDYELSNGVVSRSNTGINGTLVPLTSDDVNVSYLTFTIFGNTEGDNWNPRITISMGVSASSSDPAIKNDVLNLQTTVSAREIDCTQHSPAEC